jgi:NAD(P)-dependent dehydrogenase (short-subunit alcohol dehydrogenase family)
MNRLKQIIRYFREYRWANVCAMIRNSRAGPALCTRAFHGRLAVITGATSGIGYCTAREYASHGANLILINRNEEKSRAVCREIGSEYGVRCEYLVADLSRMEEVKRVAGQLLQLPTPIDVLIHNAGIYNTRRELSADGYEMVFAVNYLSSFVLNYLLKEKLRSQGKARILLVNSEGHRFAVWGLRLDDLHWQKRLYSGLRSYGSAKTAQLLAMLMFSDYFAQTEVTINAMHPGAVRTQAGERNGPLYRWFKRRFIERHFTSPAISAGALYYLGASEEVEGMSGRFFNLTTEEEPAPPALDRELAAGLWNISLELGGLHEEQQL